MDEIGLAMAGKPVGAIGEFSRPKLDISVHFDENLDLNYAFGFATAELSDVLLSAEVTQSQIHGFAVKVTEISFKGIISDYYDFNYDTTRNNWGRTTIKQKSN